MSKVKKPKARRCVRRISARFMSREEFADLIGVNVRTIIRNEGDGTIKGWPTPVKIGNKIRLYDRSDVERFLQEAK
jgi:predicted DNA-binding transcriptional regulator AlpA